MGDSFIFSWKLEFSFLRFSLQANKGIHLSFVELNISMNEYSQTKGNEYVQNITS